MNAKVNLGKAGGLTLYGYLLDYDDVAALSSTTFGASELSTSGVVLRTEAVVKPSNHGMRPGGCAGS